MSSWIVTLFSVLSSRTWEVNTYWIQTIGRTSMPTAAICASFRFRLLGIFYWFWQQNNLESIRRIFSSERAKEFTEVSRLRMQDLETALKHLILNILTTTTFKEKSEGAILDMVIKAACKPQASAEGKKL